MGEVEDRTKKFFDVINVIYLRRLTFFIKFNIYNIVSKPRRMNFSSIFQLFTFICQLVVFIAHALQNEKLTSKF